MSTIPTMSCPVSISSKMVMPKNMAVTGSNAPNMAVGVEPTYCMAVVVHKKDITVGKRANATTHSHSHHLSGIMRFCPQPVQMKKIIVPTSNTKKVTCRVATLRRLDWLIDTMYICYKCTMIERLFKNILYLCSPK